MIHSIEIPGLDLTAVNLFPLTGWSQVEVSGEEAKSFLHNFCTQDIKKLSNGQACEAFVCDIKGKILAHVLVAATADKLTLIGVPGTAEPLCRHLTKYVLDAPVEIRDRTSEVAMYCLMGNHLEQASPEFAAKMTSFSPGHSIADFPYGHSMLLVGTDIVPGPAVIFSSPQASIGNFLESWRTRGFHEPSADVFETLRIACGFPFYGRDLTSSDLAQNAARTSRAISFTKGCYLGQEPIARLDAMGHTNVELRGVVIDGGGAVTGNGLIKDEKEVGTLTSIAPLPCNGKTIALAKIRSQHAEPGTTFEVQTPGGTQTAVCFWPSLIGN